MKILPVESGPVYTLGYLAYDEITNKGLIIDAPMESTGFFEEQIKNLGISIEGIILTHSHWDHTADAPALKELTSAPVYIHKHDEYRIKNPNESTIWKLPFQLVPMSADKYAEDGMKIVAGNLELEVIYTPGHTEGGICLVSRKDKVVFTGDTLFNQSIGRTDLQGGNSEQLMNSINEKLLILPDDYVVFSGHGDVTDIGTERKYNPFLRK